MPNEAFWAGRRVLLTGHTGFKGSWLAIWLADLGAEVHGLALDPPTVPSLFDAAGVGELLTGEVRVDIRDPDAVQAAVAAADPEIVLHLAAQSLVRHSYREPVETWATNVQGTVNVLQATTAAGAGVRAIVSATTDKVYENDGRSTGYVEDDPLGGHDPYSASKAAADLATSSYQRSFLAERGIAVGTARAGNVIGGGDWAADRLVPDMLRAFAVGEGATVRYPDAVRPWQHVLEPLSGYLVLAEALVAQGESVAGAWNFGPDPHDVRPVRTVVDRLVELWGDGAAWTVDDGHQVHEAGMLTLDAGKAQRHLDWAPRWSLDDALSAVVEWERGRLGGTPPLDLCRRQIRRYTES